MTRKVISGGLYGDSLPGGAFAVTLLGHGVLIQTGEVLPMPFGTNLLDTVIAPDGRRIAGVANDGPMRDHAVEWDGTTWQDRGLALGQNPVIYWPDGRLVIVRSPGTVTGSQGWRTPILTCDETHLDRAKDLADYTPISMVAVGQSQSNNRDDGIVWIDGQRRLLEPGPCRFIHGHEAGGVYAIVLVKLTEGVTVLYWLTRAELAALPLAAAPPPAKPPEKPPVPEILQAPYELARIKAVFAAHPEINTKDEGTRGRILDYCCQALGTPPWGRKARTKDGSNKNTDALVYKRTDGRIEIYDVIGGGSGNATWGRPTRSLAPGENGYWAPPDAVSAPPSEPPVTPPGIPPSGDLAAALAEIAMLRRRVEALEAAKPSINGARIALRTDNGHYLCAEGAGGGDVNATRTAAGPWETFTVEPKG